MIFVKCEQVYLVSVNNNKWFDVSNMFPCMLKQNKMKRNIDLQSNSFQLSKEILNRAQARMTASLHV